jgi:hypothetical protein
MGQHDPIDGYITYLKLKALQHGQKELLEKEIDEMGKICTGRDWTTSDPLGLGGLLWDIHRLTQLVVYYKMNKIDLMEELLSDAKSGMKNYQNLSDLNRSAEYRLAFRELGLAIGLSGIRESLSLISKSPEKFDRNHKIHEWIDFLISYMSTGERITKFWIEEINQNASTWKAHIDINRVMLATSLVPDAFLKI